MTFTNPKISVVAATILSMGIALCTAKAERSNWEKGETRALHVSNAEGTCRPLEFQYRQQGVYTSYNTSAMLQYTYGEKGFSFQPWSGTSDGKNWTIDIALKGIQRADHRLAGAAQPAITARGQHMLVDYGTFAVEYQSSSAGTRQNFLVRQRMPGSSLLAVELECTSSLSMYAEQGAIAFYASEKTSRSAPVAWYKELHVWDAVGQVLPAYMELSGTNVRLIVDDNLAVYPITIDPISGSSWTAQGGQSGETSGHSIAGNLDVNGDGYPDVLVSAPLYDSNTQSNIGSVSLFLGTSSGVQSSASWTAYGDQSGAQFGWSVASAGDVNGDGYDDVIIGAPQRTNTISGVTYASAGKVYVYLGSSSGLSTTASWSVEANQSSSEFGWSVASAGDVDGDGYDDVIIGAPKYNNSGQKGKVFVYEGSSSGLGSSCWSAESDQVGSVFGYSVASAGDVNGDGYGDVVIGAPLYDNGQSNEGRAYVFLGSSSGLASTAVWTAESNQASAEFGKSVASAGNVNNDSYGDIIIGAPLYDNGQSNEGRVYLFLGTSSGVAASSAWTAESNQANAEFGKSVASAGDVNNDGYGDIIVGAPSYDDGGTADVGRVYIYGGNSSASPSGLYTTEGEYSGDGLGSAVSCAGRVNGNNKSDVLASAALFSFSVFEGGKSYLITDPELIYTKRGNEAAELGSEGVEISVFPNPCAVADATIEFVLPVASSVDISMSNSVGVEVYQQHYNSVAAGRHSIVVPLRTIANGFYSVRINANGYSAVQSLRIVR